MGITYTPSNPEYKQTTPANNTAAGSNEDPKSTLQLRDQLWHVEVWMYNQIDGFKPLHIHALFIDELSIEETIMDWNTQGFITISNDYEVFERGSLAKKINKEDIKQVEASFLFRSDGRNKISIRIYPISVSENSESGQSFEKTEWEMSYDFVIYDIEDLDTEFAAKKSRRFYFWDERYQILLERNIDWSTSLYGESGGLLGSQANDKQRTMKASEAIKSIIATAASNSCDPTKPDIKVGSSEGPKGIATPNQKLANFGNWNDGSEDSIVQYTPPAQSRAIEDINYVFKSLIADDKKSPLFLDLDRFDTGDGKKFNLIPMSYFFENAEENQIERLQIQDNQEPEGMEPYMNRAPYELNGSSYVKNFESPIASRIKNYKFVPMVPIDDLGFTNAPTHNYNFSTGEFTVNFLENTVETLLKNIKELADKGLYSYKKSKQLLLNVNKTKKDGLTVSNVFIPRTYFPKNMAYVAMAYNFLFLNQAVQFVANGLTIRQPGKYIFIDRITSTGEKNPFDDRFLGQWLINKVTHYFTKREYSTDIIATKIDMHNKWFEEMDKIN